MYEPDKIQQVLFLLVIYLFFKLDFRRSNLKIKKTAIYHDFSVEIICIFNNL